MFLSAVAPEAISYFFKNSEEVICLILPSVAMAFSIFHCDAVKSLLISWNRSFSCSRIVLIALRISSLFMCLPDLEKTSLHSL